MPYRLLLLIHIVKGFPSPKAGILAKHHMSIRYVITSLGDERKQLHTLNWILSGSQNRGTLTTLYIKWMWKGCTRNTEILWCMVYYQHYSLLSYTYINVHDIWSAVICLTLHISINVTLVMSYYYAYLAMVKGTIEEMYIKPCHASMPILQLLTSIYTMNAYVPCTVSTWCATLDHYYQQTH